MSERLHRGGAPVRHYRAFGLIIAALVFVADQLSKYIVTFPLALEQVGQIKLLPIFNFSWAENRGISMGMLTADGDTGRWLLVGLTGLLALGVLVWMWRETKRGDVLGFALVLGGALGNIIDRVRYGYVVDFLDLHFGAFRPFFIFNIADAGITIGVLILLARALLIGEKADKDLEDSHA